MKEIIIKARDLCKRFEREGTAANILTHRSEERRVGKECRL